MIRKLFNTFLCWFTKYFKKDARVDYIVKDVEFSPKKIEGKIVYVIKDGLEPDSLLFKCPCGCDEDIFLNLLTDMRPVWAFNVNSEGLITISPSIWRHVGCRSHFFIRKSVVVWARES